MASADGAPLGSSGRIGREEARCAQLDSKLPDAGGNADGEQAGLYLCCVWRPLRAFKRVKAG